MLYACCWRWRCTSGPPCFSCKWDKVDQHIWECNNNFICCEIFRVKIFTFLVHFFPKELILSLLLFISFGCRWFWAIPVKLEQLIIKAITQIHLHSKSISLLYNLTNSFFKRDEIVLNEIDINRLRTKLCLCNYFLGIWKLTGRHLVCFSAGHCTVR